MPCGEARGRRCPRYTGPDVDLAVTPATNTLLIRRLDLSIGRVSRSLPLGSNSPSLRVSRYPNATTRLAKNTHRYESDTGFSAEMGVDDLGLVTTYPGGWERIAEL